MSLIRPDMPVTARNPGLAPAGGPRAGQAAFFRAAMGQTASAVSQTASQPVASPVAAPVKEAPRLSASRGSDRADALMPNGRDLRPGSLLDIRV